MPILIGALGIKRRASLEVFLMKIDMIREAEGQPDRNPNEGGEDGPSQY